MSVEKYRGFTINPNGKRQAHYESPEAVKEAKRRVDCRRAVEEKKMMKELGLSDDGNYSHLAP